MEKNRKPKEETLVKHVVTGLVTLERLQDSRVVFQLCLALVSGENAEETFIVRIAHSLICHLNFPVTTTAKNKCTLKIAN